MMFKTRYGFRWSVNEILALQREYELLGWSIDEIADKHKRTPKAIMYKLDQEGFADYNELYIAYYNLDSSNYFEEASVSDFSDISCKAKHCAKDNSDHDSDSDFEEDEDDDDDDEDVEDHLDEIEERFDTLEDRIFKLETSIKDIKQMIYEMHNKVVVSNNYV